MNLREPKKPKKELKLEEREPEKALKKQILTVLKYDN